MNKKFNRTTILFTILIIFIHGIYLPIASAEKEIFKIRFSHVLGEETSKGWGAETFARRINAELKGKVSVEIFSNATLYKENQAIEAVSSGTLEMAAPPMEKFMELIPALQMFDIPFLFSDMNAVHDTMDGPIGDDLKALFNNRGVDIQLMGLWDNGFRQFICDPHPLILPSDAKGLKLIITGNGVLEAQINHLGAGAFKFSLSDIFEELEKGHMDGHENTLSNIYTRKYHTVQRYLTLSNHGYSGYAVVINQPFWNKLPWIIQKKITTVFQDVTKGVRQKAITIEKQNLEYLKLYELQQKDFRIFELTAENKKVWKESVLQIQKKFSDVIPEKWMKIINR